ncbi:MAG: GTPase RsgA, partial [Pseudomonadota bacterium]
MTKDYSRFLPQTSKPPTEPQQTSPLQALGWQPFFAQQTGLDEISQSPPARVVAVHRNGLQVRGEHIEEMIPPGLDATVGDWLLFDAARPAQSRVLRRKSLFKRRAPGTDRRVQLIAANVDTALIVSSCNQDFNIARLERYMALCFEAEVTPVIVLTKADLCDDPHPNVDQAQSISDNAEVLAVDARSGEAAETLEPWCKTG